MDFFLSENHLYTNCALAAGFLYRKTGQKEYLEYGVKVMSRPDVYILDPERRT